MKTITIDYLPKKHLCRLSGDYFTEIREFFSVRNEGAVFMRRKGVRFVADRKYFITPTGMFEVGMFYEVIKYINATFQDVKITVSDDLPPVVRPTIKVSEIYDNLKHTLRDFQYETVKTAMSFGRGIIKIGTGGGKTLTAASLISTVYNYKQNKIKALLIVPDLTLVNQTYSDFLEYEVPFTCTRWTGSLEPDLNADVIIANTSILQNRYEENTWINDVDLLVIDECHKLKKGNKICDLVDRIKTNNKFGLTGTLPDNRADELNIIGKLGTVIFEKTSYELRQENYLTNVEVKILNIKYENKVVQETDNKYRNELNFIYKNTFRNSLITAISRNFNNNVLILVNHIIHGEELYKIMSEKLPHKRVYFIRGEVDVDERDRVIKEMESGDNVVCIAISSIFSTGVNVKNIHMIVFGSGGKSFIRVIQSVGRGLRLNKNKNKLTIVDIVDELRYGSEHGERRQQIYDREQIPYNVLSVVEKVT